MAMPTGIGTRQPFEGEQLMHAIRHLLGLRSDQLTIAQDEPGQQYGAHLNEAKKALYVAFPIRRGTKLHAHGFTFMRSHGTFSSLELDLCRAIAAGAESLWVGFTAQGLQGTMRIAVNESALQVGLARLLRPSLDHLWSASSLISLTQGLTFRRYEGRPCTSGFICVDQANAGFTPKKPWVSWPFGEPIDIDHSFFDNVASYRYVDGVTTFYVATLSRTYTTRHSVSGTVELVDPHAAALAQRARYDYVGTLLLDPKSFLLCVNRNSEVDICPAKYTRGFLRWTKGRWRIVNVSLMEDLVGERSTQDVASAVIRAVLALSLLRLGTLILVRDRDKALPAGGQIDASPVGQALRQGMKGQNIGDLVSKGQFVNVLSSDGMTVVNEKGKIEETGWLVPDTGMDSHRAGGARTAAAKAASGLGLVVKVSADGPISFFDRGATVYETC